MPLATDSMTDYAITKINSVLVDRPEGFPDGASQGLGTVGAMAVGADLDTAIKVNLKLHLENATELSSNRSEYLAGAMLYLTEYALQDQGVELYE